MRWREAAPGACATERGHGTSTAWAALRVALERQRLRRTRARSVAGPRGHATFRRPLPKQDDVVPQPGIYLLSRPLGNRFGMGSVFVVPPVSTSVSHRRWLRRTSRVARTSLHVPTVHSRHKPNPPLRALLRLRSLQVTEKPVDARVSEQDAASQDRRVVSGRQEREARHAAAGVPLGGGVEL
jgi:hypothetical protein